jgi:hypothetical protein
MTVEDVKIQVNLIKEKAYDNEKAHVIQDSLWLDVLTDIANGNPDARNLAKAAIKTDQIKFERWYA